MSESLGAAPPTSAPAPAEAAGAPRHAGLVLAVLAVAQLMVILDGTITNIALPSIQSDLRMSPANLAWVVNSYALAFGGLLLVGGRAADLFGRQRVFRLGLALFTLASLLGGLAPNGGVLVGARVVQGVGAAIIAPTVLSLIATNFPAGPLRNRAMGVYGAVGGLGATIGLLLGGVLTDYLNWRWVMFVNVPIGVAVLLGTRILHGGAEVPGRLDLPGAVTGTAGLLALVYGIHHGGEEGWTDSLTLVYLGAAVVLLAALVAIQFRAEHPMMPLRLFGERNRLGSYVTSLFLGAGLFATFYFLTLYMQQILGWSAVRTGLAYLPFSFGLILAATVASKLVSRYALRQVAVPGLLIGVGGMYWISTVETQSSYVTTLMPAMFVTAFGLGVAFVPMTLGAVRGVADHDAGIASALLNTAQQIGGAIGLAFLAAISTAIADNRVPDAAGTLQRAALTQDPALLQRAADALTMGYTRVFLVAAGFFVVAAIITTIMINATRPDQAEGVPPVHPA